MHRAFTQPLSIAPTDIDMLGHVNNIVYLRWAQDIAIAHWRALADPEWQSAYVWVVARHEIDYRRPVKIEDKIEARTWVDHEPARGALWARFVAIGEQGAPPAAEVKTFWCLLNAQTRRPMRVPGDIAARFSSDAQNPE